MDQSRRALIEIAFGFAAGFISTLTFHQGTLAMLSVVGMTNRSAFSFTPTLPLHVPGVLSLAFWGGVWGVFVWLAMRSRSKKALWVVAMIVVASVVPSLVTWFVVAPLKGEAVAGGWQVSALATSLLVNAAWGAGIAVFVSLPVLRSES